MTWKLADAKNRLSELVTKATKEGPQTIRRSKDTVVVIAESEYLALKGQRMTFEQYLLAGPRFDGLELRPRSKTEAQSKGRDVSVEDGLIAATALRYGMHLMTRNTKDFSSTGVLLINPWEQ